MTYLIQLRKQKAAEQNHRCHYCKFPIAEGDLNAFAASRGITLREARGLQSTAEHLIALCDGGATDEANIVAACHTCNERRHRRAKGQLHSKVRSAELYLAHVQRRVAGKGWHTRRLHEKLMRSALPANTGAAKSSHVPVQVERGFSKDQPQRRTTPLAQPHIEIKQRTHPKPLDDAPMRALSREMAEYAVTYRLRVYRMRNSGGTGGDEAVDYYGDLLMPRGNQRAEHSSNLAPT